MGWFRNWRKKRHEAEVLRKCGNVCFCECGDTLNDQDCETVDDRTYRYTCRCGVSTYFDFGSYPMPVRVKAPS